MNVAPTVTDVSRAVARVDVNASSGIDDTPFTDNGNGLTMADLITSAASGISFQLSRAGITGRLGWTLSATVAVLASHGMSAFGIEQWAAEIHGRIVADFTSGRMSDRRLDTVATEAEAVGSARDEDTDA